MLRNASYYHNRISYYTIVKTKLHDLYNMYSKSIDIKAVVPKTNEQWMKY